MARKVDTTKKANIKCEHCEYWVQERDPDNNGQEVTYCCLSGENKNYWNRCKSFKWNAKYGRT